MAQRIENRESRIQNFEDLIVWQSARELAKLVYCATKDFPADERYGLIPQMRRASISITSNIAEGFGRRQHNDKEHFYVMAQGSLSELLSQVIVAGDLGYISGIDLMHIKNKLIRTRKTLAGLLSKHRS